MRTVAMILAGGAGSRLSVLTQKRAKPAVPFAGKYRIIDFVLSNCSNSGIFTVGVCTQYCPRSLYAHIQSGWPWDLDRVSGGITMLHPYLGRPECDWYQGTADAIYQNMDYVLRQRPDVVLILGGDHIYKMDYDVLITFHLDHEADLTIASVRITPEETARFGVLELDSGYRVIGFEEKPPKPPDRPGPFWGSMGIYAFNTEVLQEVLEADHARSDSTHDFGKDIIPAMIDAYRVYALPYRGYWVDVGTIDTYWQAHMDLLADDPRLDLLDRNWVIHTRSEERPPAKICAGAHVVNSLISDGCVIEGTVEHSVLSPGVQVRPGAVVRYSVVMTDAVIEEQALVDHAILDKNVRIGTGSCIGYDDNYAPAASSFPPLTVIGKNTIVPAYTRAGRGCTIAADLGRDSFPSRIIPSGTTLGYLER